MGQLPFQQHMRSTKSSSLLFNIMQTLCTISITPSIDPFPLHRSFHAAHSLVSEYISMYKLRFRLQN
jgi:hypothetical protein